MVQSSPAEQTSLVRNHNLITTCYTVMTLVLSAPLLSQAPTTFFFTTSIDGVPLLCPRLILLCTSFSCLYSLNLATTFSPLKPKPATPGNTHPPSSSSWPSAVG